MKTKSAMLQRQLRLNADVLKELYEAIHEERIERKYYNTRADEYANSAINDEHTDASLDKVCALENANRSQANKYTPFINKLSKKIKELEHLQRFTKAELKAAYAVENFEKQYVPLNFIMDEL